MFSRLKIGVRFALASVVLCMLVALLALCGYWQIAQLRAQIDDIPEVLDVRVTMASWQGEAAANAARAVAISRSADPARGGRRAAAMRAASARISDLQKRIEALPLEDASKKRFADVGVA